MKRLLLAALLLMPAPALAQDDAACEAAEEVLHWTAEALIDARDGKDLGQGAMYIADAVEYAADRNAAAGWPESFIGVLDELGMLAASIDGRGGVVEPGEAEGLLGYADALAATTLERCGPEEIPVFVRPGVGDPRACDAVIEALAALENAMRSVAGDGAAMWLLPVATESEKALGHATTSQWSPETLSALNEIEIGARLMSRGETPANAGAAAQMRDLAATIAAEAQGICAGAEIPLAG